MDATVDPVGIAEVYDLFEWLAVGADGSRSAVAWFDVDRVRASLGMGRRW